MASKFYAVGHGFNRGVYEDWNDVKKQPVYKKFDNRKDAEKFVDDRKPQATSLKVDDKSGDHFYAIARGKVVGIFTDYDKVKEHPLYKKFSNMDDALSYYKKFALGEVEEGEEEDKSGHKNKEPKKAAKEPASAFYAVARGHNTGVYKTWAECQEQTKGFKGAKFKKCDNEDEAKLFAEGKTLKQIEKQNLKRDKEEDSDGGEDSVAKSKRRRVK